MKRVDTNGRRQLIAFLANIFSVIATASTATDYLDIYTTMPTPALFT